MENNKITLEMSRAQAGLLQDLVWSRIWELDAENGLIDSTKCPHAAEMIAERASELDQLQKLLQAQLG